MGESTRFQVFRKQRSPTPAAIHDAPHDDRWSRPERAPPTIQPKKTARHRHTFCTGEYFPRKTAARNHPPLKTE